MRQVRVSVVILNWNNADTIGECIAAAKLLRYDDYEIGVVDNGSTDGSTAILAGVDGIVLVKLERNYGFAGGQVRALPHCSGEFVGIQASERAINWSLPTLAWPDILVGPGTFEGSTVFCFEQMMLDVEVFRYCRRLHQGIASREEDFLESAIHQAGPGGNFMADRSTRDALREGELYVSPWGQRATYERWLEAGQPTMLDDIRWWIDDILEHHQPLPLDEVVERELARIEEHARESESTD